MITEPELAEFDARCYAARVTAHKLCRMAGIIPTSWYRSRSRKSVSLRQMARMEKALREWEAEQ